MAVAGVLLVCLAAYVRQNTIHYGYHGISRVSDINTLGNILVYDLPVEAAKQRFPAWYEAIRSYRSRGGQPTPYRFLEETDPEIYTVHSYRFNEISAFNRTVILASLPAYIGQSLLRLPMAIRQPNVAVVLAPETRGIAAWFFHRLYAYNTRIQLSILFLFAAVPFSLWEITRRHSTRERYRAALFLLISIIGLYQWLLSVAFSYEDYGRLISPALPLLYLSVFIFLIDLFSTVLHLVKKPF